MTQKVILVTVADRNHFSFVKSSTIHGMTAHQDQFSFQQRVSLLSPYYEHLFKDLKAHCVSHSMMPRMFSKISVITTFTLVYSHRWWGKTIRVMGRSSFPMLPHKSRRQIACITIPVSWTAWEIPWTFRGNPLDIPPFWQLLHFLHLPDCLPLRVRTMPRRMKDENSTLSASVRQGRWFLFIY